MCQLIYYTFLASLLHLIFEGGIITFPILQKKKREAKRFLSKFLKVAQLVSGRAKCKLTPEPAQKLRLFSVVLLEDDTDSM